jgi:hypothetical protein
MVINNYKGGQLANRIISFAHLAANSMAHNYTLYNTEFDEFCPYFQATSTNNFLSYPISVTVFKNHFADKLLLKLLRFWTDITHPFFTRTPFYKLYRIFKSHDKKHLAFNLDDPAFVKDATSKRVIIQGWGFRDNSNFLVFAETLRQFFSPVDYYKKLVATTIQNARLKADVIIGVHIRRGDYSRFEGGKYFYTDDVYVEKMQQVQQQIIASGKTCLFLICSNESLDIHNFPAELNIQFESRHFITDLYCLAATDGIIGPPSTFSSWASFYGKVPLAHIRDRNENIILKDYVQVC